MDLWWPVGGKSTVSRLLARRHGITVYHCDFHDARAHQGRRGSPRPQRFARGGSRPETVWGDRTHEQMADDAIAGFPARFEWALDDLRALVSGRPRGKDCGRNSSLRSLSRHGG